jgi:signal transduction histidine kinase
MKEILDKWSKFDVIYLSKSDYFYIQLSVVLAFTTAILLAIIAVIARKLTITKHLEEQNKMLREVDTMKTVFLTSMSHELRTPLNAIRGFTSLVLNEKVGSLEDKQKKYLERVNEASDHLLSLVLEVLDIAKVEAGQIERTPSHFQLDDLFQEAVAIITPKAEAKNLLVKRGLEKPITIYSDRSKLLRCIDNFLSNAVKYSEQGVITLMAEEEAEHVIISVTDMGIGIAEEDIPTVFKAFERLDTPLKVIAGGTGLGLYYTKRVVEEFLSGEIVVSSKPGVGSTFGIRIPKRAV